MTDSRRSIPSVSSLLDTPDVRALLDSHPRETVVSAIRRAVDEVRTGGADRPVEWRSLIEKALSSIEQRSLRPVFNATGVILHTNLGRAPLADAAVRAIEEVARGYTNLEYDLDSGSRGSRYLHCVEILRELTGAEDAIVVNNCAAAMVLSLSALARARDVIVSRGELVEIGGSFRVPDIMERSGAQLVEVGTTNRTHIDDYVRAISSRTGAIAKIHRSNFALSGFVSDVSVESLAPIAAEHDIPIVHDLGSGLMLDLSEFGLNGEPTARDALDAGATLVLMSGDKLLGGPQAGVILGSRHAVARLKKDPLARAMRVDKLTIAALTATLELYRDRNTALTEIPTLAMIAASAELIRHRCEEVVGVLHARGINADVTQSEAAVGAGAFPIYGIPSFSVALEGKAENMEKRLRSAGLPIIGRIVDDRVLLDMRSIPADHDRSFIGALVEALA